MDSFEQSISLPNSEFSSSSSNNNNNNNNNNCWKEMAYGRRNFIAYHRGGVVGASGTVTAPGRSLASYRNKIVAILAVTVVYTAFLYKSGRGCFFFFFFFSKRERRKKKEILAGLVGCICRFCWITSSFTLSFSLSLSFTQI